jgi:predicted Ser/Thr protein kinase
VALCGKWLAPETHREEREKREKQPNPPYQMPSSSSSSSEEESFEESSSSSEEEQKSSSSSEEIDEDPESSSSSDAPAPESDSSSSNLSDAGNDRQAKGAAAKGSGKKGRASASSSSSSRERRKRKAAAAASNKRKDISGDGHTPPESKKPRAEVEPEGGKHKSSHSDDRGAAKGGNAAAADDGALKVKKKGLFKRLSHKIMRKGGKKERGGKAPAHGGAQPGYDHVAPPMHTQTAHGPLFAATFSELPDDLQKKVIRAKVDLENIDGANWEVMLNVLRFVTKLNLASDYEHYKIRKKQREARDPAASNLPREMLQAAEDHGAILRTNPKAIYNKAEFTGKGGFGKVFTCRSRMDKEKVVALKKTPNRTPKERRMNKDEIAVLHHCNHRNVVQFKRSYMWDQEMALVMEYMEGGSLSEACKKYPFEEGHIAHVAREVLNGISYLHSQNLVHRDLKSANIMMTTKGDVKLIDFGLTVHIDYCHTHMVGSPFWMPPEMIRNEPHGFPADIWSFAICLIEMADQRPPNRKSRILSLYESGTVGLKPYVDAQEKYSEQFADFLCRCLVVNPNDRATPSELLRHEFLDCAYPKKEIEKALREVVYSKAFDRSGFGGVM